MNPIRPKNLILSRETVRNLTPRDLSGIEGGANNPYTKGTLCETGGPICETASGMPCKAC